MHDIIKKKLMNLTETLYSALTVQNNTFLRGAFRGGLKNECDCTHWVTKHTGYSHVLILTKSAIF